MAGFFWKPYSVGDFFQMKELAGAIGLPAAFAGWLIYNLITRDRSEPMGQKIMEQLSSIERISREKEKRLDRLEDHERARDKRDAQIAEMERIRDDMQSNIRDRLVVVETTLRYLMEQGK